MDKGNDPDKISEDSFEANQVSNNSDVTERSVHDGPVKSLVESLKDIELSNLILSSEQVCCIR